MKISVIIPSYKPQSYIWECLDSLVAQTFPKRDFEVILVLNGCKEPYESDIRDYLSKHPELQVNFIQTEKAGVSNARNMALDVAKGEYITFIDDDDYVSPSYLEELYEKAAPGTISLCYPYAFNDGLPEVQRAYYITDVYEYCIAKGVKSISSKARRFFNGPCMKLIPINFIQGRRFDINFRIGEDSLFMFLISDKILKISFTSKYAIYYRRYRSASVSYLERSRIERIGTNLKLMKGFTQIYFEGNYSLYLYLTRMVAAFIDIFK